MSRSQSLGGFLHGAANAVVGGAAADIAAHRRVDVRIGRFAILGQEADSRHDLPGLAIAALRHVELDPGVLNRLRALPPTPSIVVTALPAASEIGVWHERTGWPSRWTVQAPHAAMPHPYFVPVRLRRSLRAQRSGMSGSASTACGVPLIVRFTMKQLRGWRCPRLRLLAARLRAAAPHHRDQAVWSTAVHSGLAELLTAEPLQPDAADSNSLATEPSSLRDVGLYDIIGIDLEMAFMNAPRERE